MTKSELEMVVKCGESASVEFKETTGQRGEACRTLCAFLNGDGGTVVFGVTRRGKMVGQLVTDETKRDLAHVFYDLEPGTDVEVDYVSVDTIHQAIVCHVDRGLRRPYRVEISNPGSFPPELPAEILMDGKEHDSVPRNQRIAEVLYKRKTIEAWGRGMALIRRACKAAGVALPRYTGDGHFVKTVFLRPTGSARKKTIGKKTIGKKTIGKKTIGKKKIARKTSESLVDVLRANGKVTTPEMARILGMSIIGVGYQLRNLKLMGRIRRVGGRKLGHWEVLSK